MPPRRSVVSVSGDGNSSSCRLYCACCVLVQMIRFFFTEWSQSNRAMTGSNAILSRRCKAREMKGNGAGIGEIQPRILSSTFVNAWFNGPPSSSRGGFWCWFVRYVRQNVASFRRRSSLRSMPSRHRILSLKTAAMSVSLLSRRVAGLSLRSAGACVGASPAVTAVSSLSTIAGSGGPSAGTTLVSASPVTAASASPCGGFAGSSQHAQRAAVQQVRFMSKKSKRSGGDDLVSCLVEPVISVACL